MNVVLPIIPKFFQNRKKAVTPQRTHIWQHCYLCEYGAKKGPFLSETCKNSNVIHHLKNRGKMGEEEDPLSL